MGKKSKKSKGNSKGKGGASSAAPAASAPSVETRDVVTSSNQNNRIVASHQPTPVAAASHQPTPPPEGATCWICLDGDLDEGGKPLVRNCSCRGSDAGYAHLSCLIQYATVKSNELLQSGGGWWFSPWNECPNCKQEYQRGIAYGMSKACLSFLDEHQAPKGQRRYALLGIILSLDAIENEEECRKAALEMISITDPSLDVVPAYMVLASLAGLNDEKELAQKYLQKAVGIQKSHGEEEDATTVQSLSYFWAPNDGGTVSEDLLRAKRAAYEKAVTNNGQHSPDTMQSGITLVMHLVRAERRRVIECSRLSKELFTASQLVYGPEHQRTTFLSELIEGCQQRRVLVYEKDGTSLEFEALQYDDDDNYLLKGPISDPRQPETEEVRKVESTGIVYPPGTPVICQGLKQAAHLNGKLGEVGRYVNDRDRYEVHFEDKSLGCASVKVTNFRIAFELPDQD